MSAAYAPLSQAKAMSAGEDYVTGGAPLVGSILDEAKEARDLPIDWVTYQKSNFLTQDELKLMMCYINGSAEEKADFLGAHGSAFFSMIITFLDKVSKKHTLQYLLTLIDDILTEDPSRIGLFLECSRQLGKMSWETFLHIVETKEDLYVQHQANRILVKIAVDDSQLMPAAQMQIYFAWVLNAMQSTDQSDSTLLALASLQTLLRQEAYRRPFFEYADSIHQLKEVLKANPGSAASIQPQYMVMVVLWVMTFDSYIAEKVDEFKVVGDVAKLMAASRKEKVIRMCVAFFSNLLVKAKGRKSVEANAEAMISFKVLPFIDARIDNKDYGGDEDVEKDMLVIKGKLDVVFEQMSSFDEYASEISSGLLEWSPVHRSERFWRENAVRLNEDRHKLIKILIQLLETSSDPVVLAVAAHDCGEYVRHHPRGKLVLEKLGGKQYIMKHMANKEHATVRYEALIAVQKLMTQNWGTLGQQLKESMQPGIKA